MLPKSLTLAFLLGALASTAAAQSLSGHIVDYNGAPVNNVNVILSNGAPLGTTDVNGNFTITGLRNRTYDVQLDPHSNFLAGQQFTFNVAGASTLGTVVLQRAYPVSATFVGPNGAPLAAVNMNAYLADGTKVFTPHDGTDASGNVDIGVPANVPITIRAIPPVGTTLVPFETVVNLTAGITLGTITMPQGYPVTGLVVHSAPGQAQLPIAGCEIVTTDMLTGKVVLQLNKLTSATGSFSVLVPFGLYRIEVLPPLGNLHVARELIGLPIINAGYNLGVVGLKPGFNLTGQFTSPAGPVTTSDIDVYTADNYKIYTPHDNTNAAGVFSVIVPAGTYSIRVDPRVVFGVVGTRTGNFNVTTNTNIGVISLLPGVPMTLNVTDFSGAPVANANVNFANPVTGEQVIIAGDFADASGHVNGIVPLGTWNMSIQAPQGSLAATVKFNNTVVAGPINTNIVMPRKNLMMDAKTITKDSILSIANGGILPIDWSFQNPDAVAHGVFIDAVVVLPSGIEVPWVPFIFLNFPAQSGILLQFQMPMPVLPANELDRIQRFVIRFRNPVDFSVVEQAYVNYVPL